jgi:hypothetical protein
MSLSYLSRPIAPGVLPSQEPIELIAQVAQQKQHRYDTVQQSVLAQYQNLLNLDASSNDEAQNIYNQKMGQATKDLESLAKLDLMNPDNISKVESVFSPILNDTKLMGAVAETRRLQKELAVDDQYRLKHPDKYNPKNREHVLRMAERNRTMSLDEFSTQRFTPTASLFFDIKDNLIKQAKDLPFTKTVGYDSSGLFIITKEGERLTEEQVMQFLTIDSRHIKQAEIDSYFQYETTTNEEIASSFLNRFDKASKQYEAVNGIMEEELEVIKNNLEKLKGLKDEDVLPAQLASEFAKKYGLESLPVTTTAGEIRQLELSRQQQKTQSIQNNTSRLQSLSQEKQEFLTGLNASYDAQGNLVFKQPLDVRISDRLKQQEYLSGIKATVAQGMAVENQTLKVEKNPYNFDDHQTRNNLAMEQFKAQLDMLKAQYGIGSGSSNSGNKSKKLGEEESGFVPGTSIEGTKETYGYEQFTTEKVRITEDISKAKNQYAEYLMSRDPAATSTNFGNLSQAQQKTYLDKATKRVDVIAKGYDAFVRGDETIKIGEESITRQEFQTQYGNEIPLYEAVRNNEATLEVMTQIEKLIQGGVSTPTLTEDFAKKVRDNKSSFTSSIITYDGGRFQVLVPPEFISANKSERKPVDLKILYDYNIAKGNIPQRFTGEGRGTRESLNKNYWRPMTFEEFNESLTTSGSFVGKEKFSPFTDRVTPLDKQFELLSAIDRLPIFYTKKGTDEYDDILTYVQGELATTKKIAVDADNITSIGVFKNPGEAFMSLRIDISDEGKLSTEVIPISEDFRQQSMTPAFSEMQSIFEIQRGVDYLIRDAAARQNENYKLYATNKKPETTFFFQGEKFLVSAQSPTELKVKRAGSSSVDIVPAVNFTDFLVKKGQQGQTLNLAAFEYDLNQLLESATKSVGK